MCLSLMLFFCCVAFLLHHLGKLAKDNPARTMQVAALLKQWLSRR